MFKLWWLHDCTRCDSAFLWDDCHGKIVVEHDADTKVSVINCETATFR